AAVRKRLGPAADEHAQAREAAPRRRAEVLGDGTDHEGPFALPVGGEEANAGGDGARRIVEGALPAVELEAAGREATGAERGLGDLGGARADLPLQGDDLTGEDPEIDVAERPLTGGPLQPGH